VLYLLAIPGINFQRATFEKVTPLHHAMANRHAECVALLLAKGCTFYFHSFLSFFLFFFRFDFVVCFVWLV
jgi:hypothetical protein